MNFQLTLVMRSVRPRPWLAGVLASMAVLAPISSRAQNRNAGEIRGTVLDPSGAVVSDASVVIENTDTGITTNLRSGASGVFDAPSLETGNYIVSFNKPGFQKTVRTGIIVHVGLFRRSLATD